MLTTNRIKLRAIEESDLPLIAAWRSDPEVYAYFYEYLPISARKQTLWYEKQLNNSAEINFVVALPDGKAIGTVSIYDIDTRNRKAEFGRIIIADKTLRNQGIGNEIGALILEYAFEHLNLHKLYCEVFAENQKALSLYQKLGFKQEAVFAAHIFKAGKYHDVLSLAVLENDYFKEREHGKLAEVYAAIKKPEIVA